MLLKLPPNLLYDDCNPDELVPFSEAEGRVGETESEEAEKWDTAYLRGMWKLCKFIQRHICIPRALNNQIAPHGASERETLIKEITHLYSSSFSDEFRTPLSLPERADRLAIESPRFLRQHLFLTSNYYHCLMLIHCDGNVARDGAMHAARTALESYFLLCKYCPSEAATWFHFQHRAYLETIVIALWLKSRHDDGYDDNDDMEQMCASENNGANGRNRGHDSNNKTNNRELLTLQAREDVSKMYTMLKAKASGSGSGSGSNNEENGDEDLVARTRARNLEECGEELWASV